VGPLAGGAKTSWLVARPRTEKSRGTRERDTVGKSQLRWCKGVGKKGDNADGGRRIIFKKGRGGGGNHSEKGLGIVYHRQGRRP